MRRRLLNLLTALSLLLCVAACVLWVRSYRVSDVLCRFEHRGVLWELGSGNGCLRLDNGPQLQREVAQWDMDQAHGLAEMDRLAAEGGRLLSVPHSRDEYDRLFAAQSRQLKLFRALWNTPPTQTPHVLRSVNYVLPAAISAALPVSWAASTMLSRRRQNRWWRAGCCRFCGYDLRATPGRCPECGTPASVSTTG